MDAWRLIGVTLATLVVVGTFLPFVRTAKWWVRILDFPRTQLLVLGCAGLVICLVAMDLRPVWVQVLITLLVLSIVIQAWRIAPYLPIMPCQVRDAREQGITVRILVANVLQSNRNSARLIALITEHRPDVVLVLEADQRWTGQLKELFDAHPHQVLKPQGNTYGMVLLSRLPMQGSEVQFLTDPAVPSIRAILELGNGQRVLFHGMHPRPPGLQERSDERQDSDQRDAELVLLARQVRKHPGPVIVAGDFNDVAWSYTTRLFQKLSGTLDPRKGRGLFSTFHARWWFMRFPLDHLFHSPHFTLGSMRRLPAVGSDHFPILVDLCLEPEAVRQQEPEPLEQENVEDAREIVERYSMT
ncbi:MAG: endonuclease/exonuclease/phosphatase family protein [Flavobacteriales bacterium]|nr:endonuclease/exonuclease/phosphatase family protein [Flavobacteriales bacterium]